MIFRHKSFPGLVLNSRRHTGRGKCFSSPGSAKFYPFKTQNESPD